MRSILQDDVVKLEQDMDERHAAEMAALEQRERDAAGPEEETTSILATDLYSFSLPPDETHKNKQPTKAQKRRQHQAEKDAEREAQLEAERAQQGESEQSLEDKQLREILAPLGLTIRAIQVAAALLLVSGFTKRLSTSVLCTQCGQRDDQFDKLCSKGTKASSAALCYTTRCCCKSPK